MFKFLGDIIRDGIGSGPEQARQLLTRLTLDISQMAALRFLFFLSSVFLRLFLRFFVATRCIFHIINWSRHAAILYNSAASLVHS